MAIDIKIKDFKLFTKSIKAFSRLTNSAKFIINNSGLAIYGKNSYARGELTTTSVFSDTDINFAIYDLTALNKIFSTIEKLHRDDFSELRIFLDKSFLRIESNLFKTKLVTCDEATISGVISKKITTALTPVLSFITSSDNIKEINNHSFIINDIEYARIYLDTDSKLENNVLYATIGNNANNMNNSITLKLGLITFGSIKDRTIILNFDRLNLFNIISSDSIKIDLMDKNVLVTKFHEAGKNDSYFDLAIYNSILAN